MAFRSIEEPEALVSIKVIGVGGGGGNAVNRMIQDDVKGVDFVVANTDSQDLEDSLASNKILLGQKVTNGRGAGANPEVGRRAADDSREQISESLKGGEMVFITAGMGGGTGTGAAPLVAEIAKEMGLLTVAVVTKPFGFEGNLKMKRAEKGIEDLRNHVDSLIVIPNERLKYVADDRISLVNAFAMADSVLKQGVQSISDLIQGRGVLNLDFADVCAIMKDAGYAHMCVASAKGKDKAEEAARKAIVSPLLETSVSGAKGIIINFTADPEVALDDIYRAADIIREEADPEANIIWGVELSDELEDELHITIIATGFDEPQNAGKMPQAQTAKSPSGYTFKTYEQASAPKAPEAAAVPPAQTAPATNAGDTSFLDDFTASAGASNVSTSTDDADADFMALLNEITKGK